MIAKKFSLIELMICAFVKFLSPLYGKKSSNSTIYEQTPSPLPKCTITNHQTSLGIQ